MLDQRINIFVIFQTLENHGHRAYRSNTCWNFGDWNKFFKAQYEAMRVKNTWGIQFLKILWFRRWFHLQVYLLWDTRVDTGTPYMHEKFFFFFFPEYILLISVAAKKAYTFFHWLLKVKLTMHKKNVDL